MFSIYIDSTVTLKIGLLNSKLKFLKFSDSDELKTASILQASIYNILKEFDIDFENIENFYVVLGPGSYTGLRMAKGLADILELNNISVIPLYLHQVPYFAGISSGYFYSNAFKNEYFSYSWDNESTKIKLLKSVPENNFYTNDIKLLNKGVDVSELIQEKSDIVFEHLKQKNINLPILYYRKIEEEFKGNQNE